MADRSKKKGRTKAKDSLPPLPTKQTPLIPPSSIPASTPPAPVKPPHKGGPQKIEFDLSKIEQLAMINCTYAEIAAVYSCSEDTIKNRMKDDVAFSTAYKKGIETGKMSLKRKQFTQALAGNTTMLIWLGKQLLGQTDKVVTKNINAGAVAVLTNLSPKERLEALMRGIEADAK